MFPLAVGSKVAPQNPSNKNPINYLCLAHSLSNATRVQAVSFFKRILREGMPYTLLYGEPREFSPHAAMNVCLIQVYQGPIS